MKVIWVSHTSGLAGAEICLWEAVKGLISLGHEVHVILPSHGLLLERLEATGASVAIIPHIWWVHHGVWYSVYYRARRFIRHLRDCKDISAYIRRVQPDLVVTNTLTIPAGALAARWAGIPHIWYIHEFGKEDHDLSFDLSQSLSCFLINNLSNKVIINSRAVLNKFQKHLSPDKLRIVYYAVNVPTVPVNLLCANETFKLIVVGQLLPGKRQDEAVRAMSILAKKGLNIRLTILGYEYKEYGSYVRRLINEHGLDAHVDMIPFTNDPFSHIASTNVLLMCSRSEAFGRVTIEAMKLGKPVIGADCAGTTELIQDGTNGLLYNPGDAKDLAEKIESLYHDRTRLNEIGRKAKEWANKTFNSEQYNMSLLKVFEEVLAEKR